MDSDKTNHEFNIKKSRKLYEKRSNIILLFIFNQIHVEIQQYSYIAIVGIKLKNIYFIFQLIIDHLRTRLKSSYFKPSKCS